MSELTSASESLLSSVSVGISEVFFHRDVVLFQADLEVRVVSEGAHLKLSCLQLPSKVHYRVAQWIENLRSENISVTRPSVQAKAVELAQARGYNGSPCFAGLYFFSSFIRY